MARIKANLIWLKSLLGDLGLIELFFLLPYPLKVAAPKPSSSDYNVLLGHHWF